MTSLSATKSPNKFNSSCSEFATMAERELAAFFRAVTRLFGSEQAQLAAHDWLRELDQSDNLPGSASEWRRITAKASTRLAGRIHASSLSPETQSV
jgi:hypothetical protein